MIVTQNYLSYQLVFKVLLLVAGTIRVKYDTAQFIRTLTVYMYLSWKVCQAVIHKFGSISQFLWLLLYSDEGGKNEDVGDVHKMYCTVCTTKCANQLDHYCMTVDVIAY